MQIFRIFEVEYCMDEIIMLTLPSQTATQTTPVG